MSAGLASIITGTLNSIMEIIELILHLVKEVFDVIVYKIYRWGVRHLRMRACKHSYAKMVCGGKTERLSKEKLKEIYKLDSLPIGRPEDGDSCGFILPSYNEAAVFVFDYCPGCGKKLESVKA